MNNANLTVARSAALLLMLGAVEAQSAEVPKAPQQDAEKGANSQLEEIVVSATRREMSLQDVPLSITAFSQEELTAKGIVGYEGLGLETAGAVLNRPTQNFNNFSVRGVATNGYNANLQSTVAIYIDELPISANGNSTVLDPTLFDVERVEFLRGPQGTLFGSGSLSGAVRILTKSPNLNEFEAATLVDAGAVDSDALRQRYNGMVNIPLIEDELALRVVGFYRNEEGYLYNAGTDTENANALEAAGGRAILQWEPREDLSIRLMALHENSEPEDSSLTSPQLGSRVRISDRPDQFHANLKSYNATVTYELENATLTSSSTLSSFDQLFYVDLAGTFNHAIAFALDADAYDDTFVQEIRLVSDTGTAFDWAVGGFYFDKRRDVDYNYRSSPEFLEAAQITGLEDEYYQRFGTHINSRETAVFGELTWNASDVFWLTGGIRYGETEVQGFTEPGGYNSNYFATALSFVPGEVTTFPMEEVVGEKGKDRGPSYKLSASYKPADNLTSYATLSTGFRVPVVNARAGSVSQIDPNDIIIPDGADSDKLTNFELGLKGDWFDNRLSTNLAAYYINWEDIQVQANRVSDQIQFATNIGQARTMGFEFELNALLTDNLTVALTGSLNDSEVTDLTASEAAISGAEEGLQLAFPSFQGAAVMTYNFDIGSDTQGFITGSVQHVGGFPNQFPNVPGNPSAVSPTYGESDSYEKYNLSVGAYIGEDLTVTLYGENLADDDSITYIHPEGFFDSRFGTQQPRTYGVRVGYEL